MKSWIQLLARRFGYEIRKAPSKNFHSAPIFDLAISYLLSTLGHSLTFIQVGANDGKFGDPLRKYILKYPWKGVLIEPQPEIYEQLLLNYAGLEDRVCFENVAISNTPHQIPLYRLPGNLSRDDVACDFASSVASSSQTITARQMRVKSRQLVKIMVPTARLDDIVMRYELNGLEILQIDTEGFDWQVLQTLDLTKTRPMLIQFEHGHLSPNVIGTMIQHLNSFDYLVYYGGHESDSVAMRSDLLKTINC